MPPAASYDLLPGDHSSPVLIHVPHASRRVPPEARASIVLDDDALERELDAMTDAPTDELAAAATDAVDRGGTARPWRFVNRLSRLVVDPERLADPALEEMTEVGMGVVYTRTSALAPLRDPDPGRDEAFTARWFTPYAEALAAAVDDRLATSGACVLVDLHSYPRDALPYERHAEDRRPPVCLGTDARHTPSALLDAARVAFVEVGGTVADEPFRGTYVPLPHLGTDLRVASIMVELRRDTCSGSDGRGAVVAALSDLVRRVTEHPPGG